jgi:membrane protein
VRKRAWHFLQQWFREIGIDRVPRLAAALAYFGVFALPAILAMFVGVVGWVYGRDGTLEGVRAQFAALAGRSGADIVGEMLAHADPTRRGALSGQVLAGAALLAGATGFMLQFQEALNTMWGAEENAKRKGLVRIVMKRLFSLAMLLTLGLLLIVSLALTAGIAALGGLLNARLGVDAASVLASILEVGVSVLALATIFALVFKFMPDLKIDWREVWPGAVVTAVLVVLGKWALGFYFGRSDPGSKFGAAGPLAILLLWTYYFALIVLVGAEFTQVWARFYGPQKAQRTGRRGRSATGSR